ncbi:constitutive coactivator of peroxisome proliferator-activated receptor gamma isoform X1 [Synchiropus splendidus]|uniref:constitutive coactivator of peroxisome proliferator-activated receptor gamma isoform X1 n=1 Tax=Synchiropus splendidus TaxID=270530 RepID=UPI00237EB7B1|nr:constitutive coactivator of peroxisome proliferator-activated receptor gamma isoform X1 [Synchiropus splendidus]XP_053721500.1 constitutive coactivator of peroxisome proliferator-activated receptor gamma isoform X1 [Synchiropus splendidus]XP_053721503.1 constitutive coactivator of peroxisome proliferator-activated receptor gamma isoform X1 [Synchiropus splendidus]
MGVKGLQYFLDRCCPQACVTVNLREMARQHAAKTTDDTCRPTLVVDGMACLRHWYMCEDWVCGGQWKEYMDILQSWVETFTSANISLVFFFDGVVEEKKRIEWTRRRCRVTKDVAKIFCHIKMHGKQPVSPSCLPSGLATFTPFALKSLGQKVFCSVQEADYEIASYALREECIGILGLDSDFIIYDSAPYLSVTKLHMDTLTTVKYDRQKLCQKLELSLPQLPLLACILGNDVVSEEQMKHIRNTAIETYRKGNPASNPQDGHMVLAVSHYLKSMWSGVEEELDLSPLNLSAADKEVLKMGICFYSLPGQKTFQSNDSHTFLPAFKKYVSPEVLESCRETHITAEGFMVYGVLCEGVLECSNSLEDEDDKELLPQAVVYKPCRRRMYGLLLQDSGNDDELPVIKEWFVYPGNPLKQPDLVQPATVSLKCSQHNLDLLWFGSGPEVSSLRLHSFFFIFDCQELSELHGDIEDSLLATVCVVTYMVLQVPALSLEDVDAYLCQAVCLRLKSSQELQQIELPVLSSRAVQLGCLYVRGLGHLLGANCASGSPLVCEAFMPWQSFDGRLFHSKYLLSHSNTERLVLVDNNASSLSLFDTLRQKIIEVCESKSRVLQSRPKPCQLANRSPNEQRPSWGRFGHQPTGWRGRGEMRRRGWTKRGESERGHYYHHRHDRPGHFSPQSSPYPSDGDQQSGFPPHQSRSRPHPRRGRYQMAPRWPPAPGN